MSLGTLAMVVWAVCYLKQLATDKPLNSTWCFVAATACAVSAFFNLLAMLSGSMVGALFFVLSAAIGFRYARDGWQRKNEGW